MDKQKILEELDKIIASLENVNFHTTEKRRITINQKCVIKAYDIAFNLRQILKKEE